MRLTFATPPSPLARWQTACVIQLLQAAHPGLECNDTVIASTESEQLEIEGEGSLANELKDVLHSGKADAVVRLLKDLPLQETPGIAVAAIPKRDAVFDVLVSGQGWTLDSLPVGARVGTSSLIRSAQLLARRPDLNIVSLTGDTEAYQEKVMHGEYDAIVVAQAALIHPRHQEYISEVISLEAMLPAPGQGALAVLCRVEDTRTQSLLASIHDSNTADAVYAERAFMSSLGAAYPLSVAAFAKKNTDSIILTGAVISPNGTQAIRLSAVDQDPQTLGRRLAELVLERGAAVIL